MVHNTRHPLSGLINLLGRREPAEAEADRRPGERRGNADGAQHV